MTSAIGRQSYALAYEQLTVCLEDMDHAAVTTIADELQAFASLLSRYPRLRRALANSGRDSQDRVQLLRSLLRAKVTENTLDLLTFLVGGRWSQANELLGAAECLGVDALLWGAERAGELAQVEDDLFRFSRIVRGDRELASALGDVSVGERRRQLVTGLVKDKVSPTTYRLALLALEGLGGRGFAGSLTWMVETAARRRERAVAYVTSATLLTPQEEQRLEAALTRQYRRKITLKTEIDPRVIGGVRVHIGSELLDGTIQRRLAEARHAMTQ